MSVVGAFCLAMLAAAAVLCVVRAIRPGTIADRAIALDTVLAVIVCGLAVGITVTGDTVYLDLALVVGLLGFLGTTAVARFVGRRGL